MSSSPLFPKVELNVHPDSDGSCSYTTPTTTLLATVNGPIEPQRRDEQPDLATLEVHLRPATGPGSPRDRHLERLLHRTLRALVHLHAHPRSLIQVTLQVLRSPAPPSVAASVVPELPHLLHAAQLALVAANIPLSRTCVGVVVGCGGKVPSVWPEADVLRAASSVHAVAFALPEEGSRDSGGRCVLCESEGKFGVDEWEEAMRVAEEACLVGEMSMAAWFKDAVHRHVQGANAWRESTR